MVSKYIVPRHYLGIAIFPFIFIKHYALLADKILINHERIHLRQQLELLILPFYLVYSVEFIVRLIQCRSWTVAYQNISFEREAFDNEVHENYLKTRPFWNFIHYF